MAHNLTHLNLRLMTNNSSPSSLLSLALQHRLACLGPDNLFKKLTKMSDLEIKVIKGL